MTGRPRVLVVDDDEDLRALVRLRLEGAGFEVVEARDGVSALERAETDATDVVVLDVMMPGLDGFGVLERLRRAEDPPNVLFLTAMGSRDAKLRALYGGASDFLEKPFDAEELVARVAAAARQRSRLAAARAESLRDPLTGLGNRRAFEDGLHAEVQRARRYRHPLALVLLDADGLKAVNDSAGHEAGDAYLRAIGRAVQAACREVDRPARIGGDEFAVVLPETGRAGAERFAERLGEALGAEVETARAAGAPPPAVSTGWAVLGEDAFGEEDLYRAADAALYRAKGEARGRTKGEARDRSPPAPPSPGGFTLVEMLAVVAIVGILAGVALPRLFDAIDRAREGRAAAEIGVLQRAIEIHRNLRGGRLPATWEEVGEGPMPLDPWGRPYVYVKHPDPLILPPPLPPLAQSAGDLLAFVRTDGPLVPVNPRSGYDLYSVGPDGLSAPNILDLVSHDDVIRADDGAFIGPARDY